MGNNKSSASLGRKFRDENSTQILEYDEEMTAGKKGTRRFASVYSRQGEKGPNQDAAILCKDFGMEKGVYCGVFDGHGSSGHLVSKLVRDHLPVLLLEQRFSRLLTVEDFNLNDNDKINSETAKNSQNLSNNLFDEWKEACFSAFTAMDKVLNLKLETNCSSSGTTAVFIIKQGKDLIIANLGDSRAVVGSVSEDGLLEAIELTTDQKPSIPEEAERIRNNKGRVFAMKTEPHVLRVWLPDEDSPGLAMTRSFGDFLLKDYGVTSVPQVVHRQLSDRDQFIVLATDGVWDVLSNEQVVSIVWSNRTKLNAAKKLVKTAVAEWQSKFPHSKVDDCSAVCLFLQDSSQDFFRKKSCNFISSFIAKQVTKYHHKARPNRKIIAT